MRKRVAFPLAARMAKLTTILLLAGVFGRLQQRLYALRRKSLHESLWCPAGRPDRHWLNRRAAAAAGSPYRADAGWRQPAGRVRACSTADFAACPALWRAGRLAGPAERAAASAKPPAIRAASEAPVAQAVAGAVASKGGIPFTMGEGDTVASVSRKFGLPVSAVLAANGLTDASQVKPGTKLMLPVDAARKATGDLPKIVPGGLKPVRPVAAAETTATQPDFSSSQVRPSPPARHNFRSRLERQRPLSKPMRAKPQSSAAS